MPNKYVVIGASAAGINAVKTLRGLDSQSSITLISKDDKIYSRCMLHHIISNHKTVEDINFAGENFIEDNNIKWLKGNTVNKIDVNYKTFEIEGEKVEYDKLLIATGASSFIPPVKNMREGKGIYSLRNIDDIEKIKVDILNCNKVAIIGAGLVGIDALSGIMNYDNLEKSLIYMEETILNLQLDEFAAKSYEDKFIEQGVKLYPKASVREVLLDKDNRVTGILLGDGTYIDCDMIIVATGVKPNTSIIEGTDIEYDRGIIINDRCETNIRDIYAAGDVTGKNAIWPLAVKQGIVAAYNMSGNEKQIDDSFTLKNSMNFMGIPTISLGICNPNNDEYEVITRKGIGYYKKIVFKGDKIYGAVIQGDISYTGVLTYLIKNNVEINNLKNRIFDIGYADFFSIKENGEFCYNI